jgi:hypothetical protein
MYGLYLVTFVITPSYCSSIIFIFKHNLLNWRFILEAAVDSISADKRQDTLIVFAGLVVLSTSLTCDITRFRSTLLFVFTIYFGGGT